MLTLWQDLRFAARVLRTNPGFTAVAALALALGVGANTAIFSVVNGVLLRPQPYAEPERLVSVWLTTAGEREEGFSSFKDFADWRAQTRSFEEMASFRGGGYTLTGVGEPRRVQGLRVSSGFFPVLRVSPAAGRAFLPEEDAPGGERVVVISHEFWQRSLGGDRGALGRQLMLNSQPHTVVGVLPRGFRPPLDYEAEVYTTVGHEGANLDSRGARVTNVIGRLKPGVTSEQAQADLEAVARALALQYPDTNADTTAYLVNLHEQQVGKVRPALWVLLAAVGLVLLIACSNVANLLLGRAAARRKEMAIRAALGAGRWRVVRQLLTESVLLSVLAGAAGLLLALWSIDALVALGPADLPRLGEIRADARVFGFSLLLSLLTGFVFGLAPALKASRPELNEALKAGGRGTTAGRGSQRLRGLLIVSQTALALVLLVSAGLLLKSFLRLTEVDPGFDPENVLTLRVNLPAAKYKESAPRVAFVQQALERARAVPGVERAAFVGPMPFSHSEVFGDFRVVGRPEPQPGQEPGAAVRSVTPDYFRVMGIPLRRGRHFGEQDRKGGGVGAAIINEQMAREYWPDQEPLGQRVTGIGANQNGDEPPEWEIVGVVGDVRHDGLNSEPKPELYLPHQQNSWSWGTFVVRTAGDPAALAEPVRKEIMAVDREQPVVDVKPLSRLVSESVAQPRFYALLVGAFSAVGLTLAVVGIYSVISYAVTERTHEIGVRMALGAQAADVRRLMIRHGMAYALAGIAAGTLGALAAARYLSSQLFGVTATDTFVFAAVPLLVAAVALAACYVPARRATKVDPLDALRYG
ncbi:MAG TPA: ABC transporter permease [Pyrinomonadaceae bacterium]|nr:ABC transporter permease [Pyrinomonadaceae bacterium]